MMQCILYTDRSYSRTQAKTVFFASFIFIIIMNLHFKVQLLHKEKQCIWIPPDNICLQAKLPVQKFHPSLQWIFKRTIHAYWVKVRAQSLSLLLTNCSYIGQNYPMCNRWLTEEVWTVNSIQKSWHSKMILVRENSGFIRLCVCVRAHARACVCVCVCIYIYIYP